MYYSHTTTSIALRAKWSFIHYNDFGFGVQSNPGTCTPCSQSSLYVGFRNPGFSYYGYLLKKSPIFCQLPRRVVTFRVCEESEPFCKCKCFANNGFHVNFVEKDENCNRTRKNLTNGSSYFDDFEDSGDEYRKYCKKERSCTERRNLVAKSGDGKKKIHDSRRHEDGRKLSKRLNSEAIQEIYRRGVRDEDESNISGYNSSSLRDYEDRRVENVRKYANNSDSFSRDSKNDRNRRVSDRRYRDEEEILLDKREHTSNKNNSALSIDFENDRINQSSNKNSNLSSNYGHRRVDPENDRRNYSSKKNSNLSGNFESGRVIGNNNGYGIERVDKEEKVVQEIRKNKDDEASFSSGLRKETHTEDFNRETIEGDEKTTYSFRKGSNRDEKSEEYVYNEQEESRKLIRSQKEDRYNRSSIEGSIDDHKRPSFLYSQHDSDMSYMDKGESSKFYVERQNEIDKQVKSQADIRKSSLRGNNVNKVTSLTSVKNSIDATRDERTHINESESDEVNVKVLYGSNDGSSMHNASSSTSYIDRRREDEVALRSDRHVEDETIRKDSIASSVENRIRRDVIDEMEAMEQYTKQTNSFVIYSSGTERVNSGDTRLEMREEDKRKESSTSKFDSSVSGIRRNDSEIISNLLEESIVRTKNQQEASSTTLVQNNDNRQKRLQSTAEVGTSNSVNQYTNDAIESARRLDESSSMHVGDFVNNLRQEASASDSHEETGTVGHKSKIQSSLRYRNKGPSDEMWEIRGTTSMESSKTEEANNDSSNSEVSNVDTAAEVVHGNIITRRAHKSLWTYIADIMKIGLGHRSDASTQKSRRSSSNASVSSEAYFSGEELDEDKDSTEKQKSFDRSTHVSHEESDRSNIKIEQPLLPLRRKKSSLVGDTGKENVHGSGSPKSKEELGKKSIAITSEKLDELEKIRSDPHVGGSTHIPIIRSAFSSRGGDMSQSQQGQGSSAMTTALTPPSVPEIESIHMPSSELPKKEETANKEESEGGMARRKLQRSKQVMTTQFEEWEEAYKREREQRLVDELFMREALLEAKKAADSWEVPVGAVLVQNGKIIARGCNLVEELRDSTAHAEMICIRQASTILKSWRLAETTLYVTLEPCAMCAGAILQARVDTVVWGAPNKLLGADGSWVRLFPNGDEGTSSNLSNSADQNAGPVHPFHPKITIRRGILATECSDTMQQFFQLRRKKKVNKEETPPPPPPPRMSMSTAPVKFLGRFHNLLAAMFCL